MLPSNSQIDTQILLSCVRQSVLGQDFRQPVFLVFPIDGNIEFSLAVFLVFGVRVENRKPDEPVVFIKSVNSTFWMTGMHLQPPVRWVERIVQFLKRRVKFLPTRDRFRSVLQCHLPQNRVARTAGSYQIALCV